jgi:hypothetical protein
MKERIVDESASIGAFDDKVLLFGEPDAVAKSNKLVSRESRH